MGKCGKYLMEIINSIEESWIDSSNKPIMGRYYARIERENEEARKKAAEDLLEKVNPVADRPKAMQWTKTYGEFPEDEGPAPEVNRSRSASVATAGSMSSRGSAGSVRSSRSSRYSAGATSRSSRRPKVSTPKRRKACKHNKHWIGDNILCC